MVFDGAVKAKKDDMEFGCCRTLKWRWVGLKHWLAGRATSVSLVLPYQRNACIPV